MHKIMVNVNRHFSAGTCPGGIVISEDLAFAFPIKCAGVQFVIGDQELWLTRDEAIEVAVALSEAARDC